MWDYQFKQQHTKIARKTGCYATCITKKTKLNETKPIKVIYTAIKSKLANIFGIQKVQETKTTPTQLHHNSNVVAAMLY